METLLSHSRELQLLLFQVGLSGAIFSDKIKKLLLPDQSYQGIIGSY